MASAVLPLSGLQIGVEAIKGNAVATTREMYPDPTGYLDPGFQQSFHEGANRGTYSNITHATLIGYAPTLSYRSESSHGVTFDELPILMSQLKAGLTPTGAGADKTWVATPVQTTHTYDTYTLNAFDANQAYELEYGFMTGFSLSGGYDDLTQVSMDFVARQCSKVTVDAVAANNAVKIPSALWTLKVASTQAGLTGASAYENTLRSWNLTVDTGLRPRWYADGSLYFGQGVASENLGGTIQMTWDSTANTVTQYDRWAAQTMQFVRLAATGPVLGGSFYSAQIDLAVLWESVQPLASSSDGVLEYALNGRLAYDATWTNSTVFTTVCSLAALP